MKKLIALSVLLCCAFALSVSAQQVQVVNAASFQFGFPVAPGSYVQVFGEFSAAVQNGFADLAALPLPTTLGNVQVLFGGVAAPIYAVENDKFGNTDVISCLVPQSVAPGNVQLQVMQGGQMIGQASINLIAEAPGIFWSGAEQPPLGGIRNQTNDFTSDVPARRGETIVMALTGQGTGLSQTIADGQAPSGLINTTEVPVVVIGVEEVTPAFSGLMPLFPGLWQINVTVPNEPYIQGRVPVFVRYGGITSNIVYFNVQ